MSSRIKRLVFALVDFGGRSPFAVIGAALVVMAACWAYASKLEVHSDVLELLPRDSPGFQSFEHQLARVGGRATIVVIAESPERQANEKFIDAIGAELRRSIDEKAKCLAPCNGNAACVKACGGREMISFIEDGSRETRKFFQDNKWLYADLKDLEEADATLDHQIAIQSGLVEDLEADGEKPQQTLGMDKFWSQWKAKADEHDSFPTGYFESKDGTHIGLWIISEGAGLGGSEDDALQVRVEQMIARLDPASFHPQMKVGLGGDIPNAKAERESLISEAMLATGAATLLILVGIVWFYGSLWAIPLVFFPPFFGVGCAYAFATWRYGFVNSSGAFLGAIILGGGINYPIVLYSRYKEFRARGMTNDVARREAVWNAFRAELVGASVASIAYGSLTVTRFRGFSQFGVIGFFGMLLVWISMIPCLPALLVVIERLQSKLPKWMREAPGTVEEDGARGPVSRIVGDMTARRPGFFVLCAAVATFCMVFKLPGYLKDPWEYDFDKLGSKHAREMGAFKWSAKGKAILKGTKNLEGALVLVDKPEQVLAVKQKILANDAADPSGSLIEAVNTIWDYLPGAVEEQKQKLEVLDRIRDRITEGVLAKLSEDEAKKLREMKPPEGLHVLEPKDVPSTLRHRFQERNGTIGTPFYVDYRPGVSTNDGHTLLRIAKTMDGVVLPDGTRVDTASRSTVFAEMIRSLERDGPLATGVSFVMVVCVVLLATSSKKGSFAVILSLVMSVACTVGLAAWLGVRLNFLNFVALPITFGIGSEYPFNIFDRSRLLGGDVTAALKLHLGAVSLCSYTTIIGYGSLLFADNQALQSFGKLSIAGEFACVLGALLFLPSLLHIIAPKRTAPLEPMA